MSKTQEQLKIETSDHLSNNPNAENAIGWGEKCFIMLYSFDE